MEKMIFISFLEGERVLSSLPCNNNSAHAYTRAREGETSKREFSFLMSTL